MPTISVSCADLEHLVGRPMDANEVESWLPIVKGELKDHNPATGELRIEVRDSNRPDLWCCEGIARQIRIKLAGSAPAYACFKPALRPKRRLVVEPGLEQVRPYVAACAAVGCSVTDEGLIQLIQTQEKLADIFGRKRRSVSIGLYRLQRIAFPVTYALVNPDEVRFTPLGFEEEITLREILAVHPKGIEYGSILDGKPGVPLLRDAHGRVLSFPPIINSRDIGEVQVGDKELLVEVTGTDLRMVLLALNILAVNLADRGAAIEPVEIFYPQATEIGKRVRTPHDLGRTRSLPLTAVQSALGQPLPAGQVRDALLAYGYQAKLSRDGISVKLPPYRNDMMHDVDVVEDVAISLGYDRFELMMPSQFTVGGLSRLEQVSDRVRELMVGIGFQEVISNVITSRQELVERMRLAGSDMDQVVEIDNVMSQNYSCLRQWMTPSLLRVESASTRAFYPHRLFEVGEVAVPDPGEEFGSRTMMILGALIAHATANFSEVHSCLDLLLFYLNLPYSLEPNCHPSFLEGRSGWITSQGRSIGLIGELHPEVLEQWQVGMPTVVFELEVNAVAELLA